MISTDDFTYALENTRVLVEPRHAIETFGQTSFRFQLVTEPMDEVGTVRVRAGQIHAERPRIMAPQHMNRFLLEGFGEEAEEMIDLFQKYPEHLKVLRYGFVFKKTDISEKRLRQPKEEVLQRLRDEINKGDDQTTTLIEGIDDAWEACLIKFTMDLIQRSAGENVGEWKKRGFI
jgi:hypothetical protein